MDTEPVLTEQHANYPPVAMHITLVPEGISSVRDIPGLNRATQGERSILNQIQQTIDVYGGQPVVEFWNAVWKTMARCLRMQSVYLFQVLRDVSSEDFLWLRTLYTVDSTGQEAAAPQPLRSGIYAAALRKRQSDGLVLDQPTRLDVKPGAFSKVPRSVESQMQNEGLTCFYIQEMKTLAEKQSSIISSSGDGTNHIQLLPISGELTGGGEFYLGFDRHGVAESIGSFGEMIEFVHQRLNPMLNDFIRVLLSQRDEPASSASLPTAQHPASARRSVVLYKPADSLEHPLLSRDLVLAVNPGWPWHRRVVGLFTVEGTSGKPLNEVTESVHRLLSEDFSQMTKADPVKVLKMFWTWHIKIYLLAKELQLPIRVSGSILSERAGEWEMYSLGTAPPVLHVRQDPKTPILFEMPGKNLHFLGYNPISTSGTGKAMGEGNIPTERMHPESFLSTHRTIGICKRNTMILFSSGWLEQCNPLHGPAVYEARYNSMGLLGCLRRSYEQAGIEPCETLAQRLAEDVASFSAMVHDATLVVVQG